MPRNMSFAMTINQFNSQEKDVTRRFSWWFLKPGDIICGVEKSMGLKCGEKIKKLGLIKIISTRKEPLNQITKEECIREGFPDMEPVDFIKILQKNYSCDDDRICNRIEFEYMDRCPNTEDMFK